VEPRSDRQLLIPEQRQLAETVAALTAIALERVHFVTVARDTLLQMESERLRNSLLEALSHDLRTPLTALVGLAETLARDVAAGRGDSATAWGIRAQALRTAELVDSLLEMARLQSGRVMLRRDWQSLEELAGAAIASIGPALSGHDVAIEIPEGFPLLHCDGALFERVLVNLLENAARHTPPGTRVVLAGGVRDGMAEIRVEDNGPGLPPGETEALFEKFVRGGKASEVSGMGLGLAICRTIVEAHGGRIRAERRAEGGARFVVTLPVAAPPPIEIEPASTAA
jgi:two-component system sensor histidine kinase KdpD